MMKNTNQDFHFQLSMKSMLYHFQAMSARLELLEKKKTLK